MEQTPQQKFNMDSPALGSFIQTLNNTPQPSEPSVNLYNAILMRSIVLAIPSRASTHVRKIY